MTPTLNPELNVQNLNLPSEWKVIEKDGVGIITGEVQVQRDTTGPTAFTAALPSENYYNISGHGTNAERDTLEIIDNGSGVALFTTVLSSSTMTRFNFTLSYQY